MQTRRARVLAVLCLAIACVAGWLGANYIPRLSDHAGYYLVAVDDAVKEAPAVRPRRVALVVVDGLREDSARAMASVQRLADAGQCRASDVGTYTVSRPIYALMSTGLEVDRTGARNNEETAPLAAESVWDVAAQAGLRVTVASHLPWWRELFPAAFATAIVEPESIDVFAASVHAGGDVSVIHPVYVDTMGHDHGADSDEYRDAVARVDREASAWLDGIDLSRDLVVFTADHGHIDAGGHGAQQPEVRTVLLCFAGPGIAHREDGERVDARIVGPAIAMASGLRFPRHMRAGDDGLDALWGLFDPAAVSPAYVASRRAAVDRFRLANTEALAGWLGHSARPSWEALRQHDARARWPRIAGLLVLIAAGLGFAIRLRGRPWRDSVASLLWMAGTVVLTAALWVLLRGSFDYTSINLREPFIAWSLIVCGTVAALTALAHRRGTGNAAAWAADETTLAALGLALMLAHIVAFGWPLGYPIPHRYILFVPFLAATFTVVHALLAAFAWTRARPHRSPAP